MRQKGQGIVTAGDIADSTVCKVSNPDQVIATLTDAKAHLKIEMTVERGVGYTLAREQKTDIVGEIILDATFTPVLKANYTVEPTRLGKKSNYDKLTMEIWTDASVDPLTALKMAAKDLINALDQIVDTREFEDEVITLDSMPINQMAEISVEEIELPLRVTNALKKADYSTINDLVKAGRADVSKAKNVGEKSLKIIDAWLEEKGFPGINKHETSIAGRHLSRNINQRKKSLSVSATFFIYLRFYQYHRSQGQINYSSR